MGSDVVIVLRITVLPLFAVEILSFSLINCYFSLLRAKNPLSSRKKRFPRSKSQLRSTCSSPLSLSQRKCPGRSYAGCVLMCTARGVTVFVPYFLYVRSNVNCGDAAARFAFWEGSEDFLPSSTTTMYLAPARRTSTCASPSIPIISLHALILIF